jgi:hypothetical protein
MFDRIFRRRPRIGGEVTVLAGPYAGYVGRVSEIDYNGRFRVFIDDCCQPLVESAEFVLGMPRDLDERIAAARRPRPTARDRALVR